jgi:hypothetical protein
MVGDSRWIGCPRVLVPVAARTGSTCNRGPVATPTNRAIDEDDGGGVANAVRVAAAVAAAVSANFREEGKKPSTPVS